MDDMEHKKSSRQLERDSEDVTEFDRPEDEFRENQEWQSPMDDFPDQSGEKMTVEAINASDQTLADTVKEVLLGICFFTLVELLATVFFIGGNITEWNQLKITSLIGLLVGAVVSVFLFLHMKHQMVLALELGKEEASKKLRVGYALRLVVILAVLALALITQWLQPIGVLLGALNLKFAVYLQPTMHRILGKKSTGGKEM